MNHKPYSHIIWDWNGAPVFDDILQILENA